jgi:hypothetical protein
LLALVTFELVQFSFDHLINDHLDQVRNAALLHGSAILVFAGKNPSHRLAHQGFLGTLLTPVPVPLFPQLPDRVPSARTFGCLASQLQHLNHKSLPSRVASKRSMACERFSPYVVIRHDTASSQSAQGSAASGFRFARAKSSIRDVIAVTNLQAAGYCC